MLRKVLALVVMTMGGSMVQAQEPSASPRFRFGMNLSPDMAYRTTHVVQRTTLSEGIQEFRDRMEIPRFGYSASLMAGYAITDRIGVEAGVGYALRGWQLDISQLTFGDQIDPRRGFVYTTSDGPLTFIGQEFHYLDLPVRGTYTLGNGRWRWISGLGVSLNFLVKATSTVALGDDRSVRESEGRYHTVNLSPMASTGVAYAIGERMELRLEPSFRYGVIRISEDPITETLWSGGLNFGWFVRL
jgi:hypothetical protein